VILLAAVASHTGCATSSSAEEQSYKEAAETLYKQAKSELERESYRTAIRRFRALRERFPYSRYAKLASLGIADAYYGQSKFRAAAQQYKRFVELNPNHPKAQRAEFRVAESYYKLMPGNWFFQPPAHERDLSSVKKARRKLQSYLQGHRENKFTDDASRLLRDVTHRLAKHELSVAEFYLERSNYEAARSRVNYLLQNYSGTDVDPKALFLLAKANLEMGRQGDAKTALKDLIRVHPDTQYAKDARQYMTEYNL
jgi:outer membrane protein assembly factor BamD